MASSLQDSLTVKQHLIQDQDLVSLVSRAVSLCLQAVKAGKKLLLFGNGGSAADCQHIAADFVGRFAFDRAAMPAIALTVNSSSLTAIANDYGFEQ
ncbi:MAG TPA: SIS domain-containing protein, partial [Dongiaceae bacterium]|nr:SIS domain-containing protein [Dongiaceae bacterium]